eukprot:TRINITY_DN5790_c1_g3_i2.p1 TRINITY_DN5790_c1_g3~~TRINITY_DN5790_c1_g3_i2.p1  ORF type:complete len:448 (+),score=60.65 TRINITY_DN5790_c1_g3_i2:46-1389(+)
MSDTTSNPLQGVGDALDRNVSYSAAEAAPVKGYDDVSISVSMTQVEEENVEDVCVVQTGQRHPILRAILFVVAPMLLSMAWMVVPASESGKLDDPDTSLALMVTLKIPLLALAWSLNMVLLINDINERGNYSSNMLVPAMCPLITGLLVRILYSDIDKSWQFLASVGAAYVISQALYLGVRAVMGSEGLMIEVRCVVMTILMGCQLTMSSMFGWLFGLVDNVPQMMMCLGYPFLVLFFKVLMSKVLPASISPEKHIVMGGASQLYAAFPYRIIFMFTKGGDLTVIMIYCIEVVFKCVAYLIPMMKAIRGGRGLSWLPASIPTGNQRASFRDLSVKFGVHQFLDFSQAAVLVFYLSVTSSVDVSTQPALVKITAYMRNRLLIVYGAGAALEILIWFVFPLIANRLGATHFQPWESFATTLTKPAFYVLVSGCVSVQVLMLAFIGDFNG